MSIRDEMPPIYRAMLDTMLMQARNVSWAERGEVIAGTFGALQHIKQSDPTVDPEGELPLFIAALVEDCGTPPVTEAEQAMLYSMSSVAEHREAGEAWIAANPEAVAALEGDSEPPQSEPTLH
jgi:hypothetical protein